MTEPVTVVALLSALILAVLGAITSHQDAQLQDTVQALALVAATTGIYANRHAAALERRHLAIGALAEEFLHNLTTLNDRAFEPMRPLETARIYPRVGLSAVDAALAANVLGSKRDEHLVRSLHAWRNAATQLNRGLDLAETIAFGSAAAGVTGQQLDSALHAPDGQLERAVARLHDLQQVMAAQS